MKTGRGAQGPSRGNIQRYPQFTARVFSLEEINENFNRRRDAKL